MTIKELEEKTGLQRANIRYYEQQGLLTPERKENGYRDYSAADLATLQKIKLLRHLGLSIETIKQVQAGECPLTEALAAREEDLAKEASMLGREKMVCQELRMQQMDYVNLQPEGYLEQLEREEAEAGDAQMVPRPEAQDIIKPLQYPWRRYFARKFDLSIYSVMWSLISVAFLKIPITMKPTFQILQWAACIVLMLIIEPLLLSRFGTTPGKAIFGLQVRGFDGKYLTYDQAMRRTRILLARGMGLDIPFVNWYYYVKNFNKLAAGTPAPWDENTVYTIKDTKAWRGIAFVVIYAMLFFVLGLVVVQITAPPNSGLLTKEAFIENCNDSAQRLEYHLCLEYDGTWQEAPWKYSEEPYEEVPVTYEIQTRDGYVESIQLSVETQDEGRLNDFWKQAYYSYAALRMSKRSLGGMLKITRDFDSCTVLLEEGGNMTFGNVTIQCDVVNHGMTVDESGFLKNEFKWQEALAHDAVENGIIEWKHMEASHASYACTITLSYAE